MTAVGLRLPRLEDGRLLRGQGRFVDDVDLPGQLWLRVVRSPVAHGLLRGVDLSAAARAPGVVAVLDGSAVAGLPPIPMRLRLTADSLDDVLQPVLAQERVRYVGEPLAVVVADDAYSAEDAAELVALDIEPLPVVLDARAAISTSAASLWPAHGNEVATITARYGDLEVAFAAAAEVVDLEVSIGRHTAVPMETRGLVAQYDHGRGRLVVWGATKVPHWNRKLLAGLLGLPVSRIHFPAVDAGGGFGVRGEFYPEDFLVPFLARRLGRPVKWIEDRSEHLVATNHSREQRHCIRAAFTAEGTLLALRDEVWHDNGAYLRTHGVTVPELTANMLPGPYRLPAFEAIVHVVTTNKTPAGTYRAPGRYEGTFARERLLDVASARLGLDRLELRRRNLLTPQEIPHLRPLATLGTHVLLDAGDYPGLLDKAVAAAGFAAWEAEAATLRVGGRLVGTGVAYFLEKSGLGPYETAAVQVDESGAVRVFSGGASLGQGLETVMAQIAAEELGVELSAIEVLHTDTDLVPDGVGSWASRSTVVGGSATYLAARDTADKARRVGAELLGVSVDKVVLGGGQVQVRDTDRSVTLGEVAQACDPLSSMARGDAPGLGASGLFAVEHMTYPYGVHLAQVEVDPDTGKVDILRYHVTYEVGRAVNPQLVEGQLSGGFAQGMGGALFEEFRYDAQGQPLATQFLDYLLPTASETPAIGTLICEDAPTPHNPLGVKGAGEGGTTGSGAAIASAVEHALGLPGSVRELPMTPERLRSLLPTDERTARCGWLT